MINSTELYLLAHRPNCSVKVQSISKLGEITLIFNYTMQTNFNLSLINQTNTILKIIPAQTREQDEDFDPDSIKF